MKIFAKTVLPVMILISITLSQDAKPLCYVEPDSLVKNVLRGNVWWYELSLINNSDSTFNDVRVEITYDRNSRLLRSPRWRGRSGLRPRQYAKKFPATRKVVFDFPEVKPYTKTKIWVALVSTQTGPHKVYAKLLKKSPGGEWVEWKPIVPPETTVAAVESVETTIAKAETSEVEVHIEKSDSTLMVTAKTVTKTPPESLSVGKVKFGLKGIPTPPLIFGNFITRVIFIVLLILNLIIIVFLILIWTSIKQSNDRIKYLLKRIESEGKKPKYFESPAQKAPEEEPKKPEEEPKKEETKKPEPKEKPETKSTDNTLIIEGINPESEVQILDDYSVPPAEEKPSEKGKSEKEQNSKSILDEIKKLFNQLEDEE